MDFAKAERLSDWNDLVARDGRSRILGVGGTDPTKPLGIFRWPARSERLP